MKAHASGLPGTSQPDTSEAHKPAASLTESPKKQLDHVIAAKPDNLSFARVDDDENTQIYKVDRHCFAVGARTQPYLASRPCLRCSIIKARAAPSRYTRRLVHTT